MFWNLKEASVRVGDSYVDYAVFGKGNKPMVIIPGLTLRDVKGSYRVADAVLSHSFFKVGCDIKKIAFYIEASNLTEEYLLVVD